MKQIDRYLGVTVGRCTLLVVFFLLSLDFFFSFVNELRYVGTGDYGMPEAIAYILLTMPQSIYQMFPLSALLGSIIGLGLLAGTSELIAMRASGVSYMRISMSVLKAGLLMAAIAWLIGEMVAPASDRLAQNQRAFALSGGQALMTTQGTWMRDNQDFIHIGSLHNNGQLEEITRYRFDENFKLEQAVFAARAMRLDDHWILYDVKSTRFGEMNITNDYQKEAIWKSDLDPEVLRVVGTKYLEQLSLKGLWHSIDYRKGNGLDYAAYELAFWEKILQPFVTLVMMLLGMICIFGPMRNANFGLRTLLGFIIGFSFHVINHVIGPLSLLVQVPAILGALMPALLMLLIITLMMRKIY